MRYRGKLLLPWGFIYLLLAGCGAGRTDELVNQLNSPDPSVRRAAVRSLEEAGGDATVIVPALEQRLDDSDPAVQLSAAVLIQHLDPANENCRPVIIAALEAGHAPMFLEVGRMGPDAAWAVPTLTQVLAHPRPQVRVLAARAIGDIGVTNANAEAALERRLRDEAAAVRTAAELALEQIRSNGNATETN